MDKINEYFADETSEDISYAGFDLLPVLDSLEIGKSHNKEFEAIYNQLINILSKQGIQKISVKEGDEFDVNVMECISTKKYKNKKDNTISKVIISGYTLSEKIIRFPKVEVVKN
jgi:molecular chaperone GrpE (heat shock protein)